MNSLTPEYLDRIAISPAELRSVALIGHYKGRQDLWSHRVPEVLTSLTHVARVESIESSNRIEGITAAKGRVRELTLHHANPRDRSEQEIAGYREALNLIHSQHADIPFTGNVVLQLHQMLYRFVGDVGGRWKPADNAILEHHADGSSRLRFMPVPAVATPQAMRDLVDRYRAADQAGHEPLVTVPLAVLDFLCIHPFRDGNGRAARLLSLFLLYHHGYEVGRYISLERVIEGSKASYYETLERSSQGWHEGAHDPHPWLRYFWGVLLAAYKELEERVGSLSTGPGAKGERVRAAVARKLTPFAISDLERDCPDVSREHIRKVLLALRAEGAVRMEGMGRGARWRRER